MTRDEFRIRKSAAGYRVWQYEGGRWHGLADVHPTREDARAWINRVFGDAMQLPPRLPRLTEGHILMF